MSDAEAHRVLFENAPDGILLVDRDGSIIDANPASEAMFGWEAGTLAGQAVEVLVPTDARGMHHRHRDRFVSEAHGPRPMGIGMELRGVRKDGGEFPVEISLSPIGDGRAIATVRDVSLRRRLRDFSAGALRAVEDVRAEIARELHDQTAQELAAMMIQLRLLDLEGTAEERAERIEALRDQLLSTAEGIRRIARGLRPPELEDAGLATAFEAHARRLWEDRELRVDLDVEPIDARLTPDSRLIVYRVVQEALNNVARHSGVDRAQVRVWVEEDRVHATVKDRGRGFSSKSWAGDRGGLGVMGMHERASMVGGHLAVRSTEGEGTEVHLQVPVEFDREISRV